MLKKVRKESWICLFVWSAFKCWAATRPPSSTKTKQQRLKKKKVSAIFSSFLSLNWMSFCNEVLTFWPLLHATNFLHLSNLYIRLFNMHRNHNPVLPFKFSHSWPTGVSPDALCATKRWESDSFPPPHLLHPRVRILASPHTPTHCQRALMSGS